MRRRWPAGLTALLLCLLLCAAAAGQGTQEPFLPAEQDGRWRLVVDDQVRALADASDAQVDRWLRGAAATRTLN